MGCTDFVNDQQDTQNKNLIFIESKAESKEFTKQRGNNGDNPAMVAQYNQDREHNSSFQQGV